MLSMANLRTFLLGDSAILFKMNPAYDAMERITTIAHMIVFL